MIEIESGTHFDLELEHSDDVLDALISFLEYLKPELTKQKKKREVPRKKGFFHSRSLFG
jgi:hypothetical protein